ncbi:MAG: 16S rRNA (cytosine(1402)-N(4))-methyltransferase RsmH [Hyphomicrobium sp.]|uniref:16S rRNA (cytosine(1402)-N(4))-methyltransferase RsmH n=1 Tax=Hyphomicrobium sp. TaxID=82 RepID=UPI001324E281|nr:16S rRNA (cytosine(1402)-N(4))-methyltransferase RsmH [Hyphomicrobium sp.]KAB2937882.1 MAG: 16S rRNA (cytosine(1402)-N(4))-methyltransferase RsmH [Hyphomicrobium sp.]MBZ0210676.1 16S rRNA (cytosine(1402)-N(4))-methyltransferase RsmH [Hyphomicrobium sp.]
MTGRGRPGGKLTEPGRARHIPVLLAEVIASLRPLDGATYIDGTFGAGGYTRAILEAADCRVLALDRDPRAILGGKPLLEEFADRLTVIESRFSELDIVAREQDVSEVDGVVLDIGVSSMQLDEAERGFSFQSDGPLDMRMSASGTSAADVINEMDEEDLARILYVLGEERRSRAIARAIVKARTVAPITTTRVLADLVSRAVGGRRGDDHHPATRTFQALRIYVNDELGELARGLAAAERCLKPGGRLVVVTFHSLEDRIVKRFLQERAGKESRVSRHLPPQSIKLQVPSFEIVNPRPLTPSKEELEVNPRARSARLRAAVRTEAPAWPLDEDELGVPSVGD